MRSTARASTSKNLSCRSAALRGALVCRGLEECSHAAGREGGLHLRRGTVSPFSSQRLGLKRSFPALFGLLESS